MGRMNFMPAFSKTCINWNGVGFYVKGWIMGYFYERMNYCKPISNFIASMLMSDSEGDFEFTR